MAEILNMDGLTQAGKAAVFYYAVALIAADFDYNYDALRLLMRPGDKRKLDTFRQQVRQEQWNPDFLKTYSRKEP